MIAPSRATLRQRFYTFLLAGIGGTAAAAVSFGMTLYDAANPATLAQAKLGEPIDTGRWAVTIHSARTGTMPPTGIKPSAPKPLLMVDLDIVNRSATPTNVVSRVLKPAVAGAELPMPVYYLTRDAWIAGWFNPDMPERVTAVWELPAAAPLPENLRLEVMGQVYKRRDNLYGASGWYDGDAVAFLTVPVAPDAAP